MTVETPNCSLAVVDLQFDNQAERDALAALVEQMPSVPFVVTLGFPRPFQIERLRQLGVGWILSKPLEFDSLVQAIFEGLGSIQPKRPENSVIGQSSAA